MRTSEFDIFDVVLWLLFACLGVVALVGAYAGVRIYIADQFVIPSSSMEPTLIPGDRVIVNKLIMGARIYDEFDFCDGAPLVSHRTRGIRDIKHNDILIFNFPINYDNDQIEFELNYVYGKRCVGIPGDSVSGRNGYLYSNNYDGVIGSIDKQRELSQTPDSLIHRRTLIINTPYGVNPRWTIKNFGPLYVPKEGESITLDLSNYRLYERVVTYETGLPLNVSDEGVLMLGDKVAGDYTFTKNYYYVCGDNVINSGDSRYWGFVPEEFVVGVVSRITYSRDIESDEFRWSRFMKSVMN